VLKNSPLSQEGKGRPARNHNLGYIHLYVR
jgi:hypothetical protein